MGFFLLLNLDIEETLDTSTANFDREKYAKTFARYCCAEDITWEKIKNLVEKAQTVLVE